MVEKFTNSIIDIINLYRNNYSAQYYVRELSRMTNKSHATLIPHLKRLERANILLSKTVGKNKQYRLNTNNIITKYYITITETVTTALYLDQVFIIKRITKDILDLNLRGTIILFGSYAKKSFHEDSDIDIYYIGALNNAQLLKINRICRVYGKKINVKTATIKRFEEGLRKKEPLIQEIVKNHIILQNPEPYVNMIWRLYYEQQ
ncbi:MAG: nucleotidyltransferase domain-containing protein [Candidatus Woesearchaeota archaeon]